MAINKTDLKFYLTHAEPLQEQYDPSASIGGYASSTEAMATTATSQQRGRDANTIALGSAPTVAGREFLLVGDELMELVATGDTTAEVLRGVAGTESRSHVSGAPASGLGVLDLFDNEFGDDLRQYRCVALMNTSETEIAYDVSVYLRYGSRNPNATFKVAVEVPSSAAVTGTADSGTTLSMTDEGMDAIEYEDNAYRGAVLTILSGTHAGRSLMIASYDKDSRTVTFAEALPSSIASGTSYRIDAGPAQRLLRGTARPIFGEDEVSTLEERPTPETAQWINVNSLRPTGGDLMPGDLVYVWIERTLKKNAESFDNNSVVLAVRYTK